MRIKVVTPNAMTAECAIDSCVPLTPPQFKGPQKWGNASSPHGNHPKITFISYFSCIFKVEMNLPHLNFDFSTLIPSKMTKIVT